ncbi:MAG: 3-oxoacyl-[acyl-carrier protein] reductase [Candidatus Azotimanducaceae bacterium]|jgi:3-oxoacyl-[acyl-carrier protein] reductase
MALSVLSRSVAGKVVVITGAASGMGRATAHLFADEGATVALIDINKVALDSVVKEIIDDGGQAKGWQLDLSCAADIAAVIDDIAVECGAMDILINNAGISIPTAIDGPDYLDIWNKSVAVLLTAHTHTIRAALPYLRKAEHPRIINVASTEALGASKFSSPYTAAKSGVVGLTRSLAVELGVEAITVNCVCPGPINTGMTDGISQEHKTIFARRRVALRRYAEPEEVAHGILSLALPASQYITGVTLPIDGGLTIRNA